MTTRIDPINEKYYRPLEIAEKFSGYVFYILAALSFVTLLIEKNKCPLIYQVIVVIFAALVLVFFLLNLFTRYCLFPSAEDARRREFVSNVYGVQLTHERTNGYYNNGEINVNKKLIVTLMENTFFSKSVLGLMLKQERLKCAIYVIVFFILILFRSTPIDWLVICSQVLFSEEILVRWVRMEWLKARAENIYDNISKIVQSDLNNNKLQAFGIELFGKYESGKTLAGIVQSEAIFTEVNPALTQEWERIKQALKIN